MSYQYLVLAEQVEIGQDNSLRVSGRWFLIEVDPEVVGNGHICGNPGCDVSDENLWTTWRRVLGTVCQGVAFLVGPIAEATTKAGE